MSVSAHLNILCRAILDFHDVKDRKEYLKDRKKYLNIEQLNYNK